MFHMKAGRSALKAVENPFDLFPNLAALYESTVLVGRSGRSFRAGFSTRNNIQSLWTLARSVRPERTLEIGMCFGGSSVLFAIYHEMANHAGPCHTALDPFQSSDWDNVGALVLEHNSLQGHVRLIEESSHIALPSLLKAGESFDLIYVDGSHLFEHVFIDAFYSLRLLREGGVVVYDDYCDPHVRKVIQFIRTNCPSLQEIPWKSYKPQLFRNYGAHVLNRQQMVAFSRAGQPERLWNTPLVDF